MSNDGVLNVIIQKSYLNDTLDILQAFADEAVFHLGSHGLKTQVIDPATVAMHNPIELAPEAFENTPREGSYYFGVNLERLGDYISKASSTTPIQFSFKPENRMLNIQYDGADIDMACIDSDSIRSVNDTPDMDLPNMVTIAYEQFKNAVEMTELVSDHVAMDCDPDREQKLQFVAEGDTDDITYGIEDDDVLDGEVNESTLSLYSIDYLEKVSKAMPNGIEVEITVGREFPVFLNYEYADGHGSVQTMVAPRIQSD